MGPVGFALVVFFTFLVCYYTVSWLSRSSSGRKRGTRAMQSWALPAECPDEDRHPWARARATLGSDWCDDQHRGPNRKDRCPGRTRAGKGPGKGTGDESTLYELFWSVAKAVPNKPLLGWRRVLETRVTNNSAGEVAKVF